jgi:site-specific DNA-methyltransferase (adenine-specific)
MSDLKWTPVKIRLGQVKPWTNNPRMSTKAQAERLIQSERELGQVQTIAVGQFDADGFVPLYDGHQRYSAWLTVKGAEYELTALQSNRDLTEDERRKMAILLHTATGGWDWNKMSGWQVGELKEWGLVNQENVKGWNTDANNVKEILAAENAEPVDAEPQIDRAAELLEKWQISYGDMFQIGEHRLLCGDSTKREDVERVMGGLCDAMIADPPYNVGLDYDEETDDGRNIEDYWTWQRLWFKLAKASTIQQIVTPGCINLKIWINEFSPNHIGVWDKGEGANTHGRVTKYWAWEPIMCHGKFERNRHTDVFRYSALGVNPGHPCPKPITLWQDIIENILQGNTIYDPFSGSGTTLVACENLHRRGRAIEISSAYCAVTLERMSTAFPYLEIKRI